MKKKEFVDKIRLNVQQIDKTAKFHPKFVEMVISSCYNEILVQTYTKDLYDLGLFTKKYGDDGTPIAIVQNTNTLEWYSIIPEEIVPLPDLNSGVREILSLQSNSLVFAPMKSSEIKLIEGLECQEIDDVIGYTVYNGRIVYTGMTSDIASAGVVLSLIIPLHAYDDDDIVYFPKGQERTLTDLVLAELGVIQPKDLVNNNSDVKQVRQ